MGPLIRFLLLADTHLGFDEPLHPRVERPRRGADFLANFERALEPALRGEVDAVVHGGDLLYRSRVPFSLVERAFRPMAQVAARGVPIFIVPGNHERSRIPFPLLAAHRSLFVFDRPRTFTLELAGASAALSGFPFAAEARARFRGLLWETGHAAVAASLKLLCLHQAIEGAKVGTPEFVFRDGGDVIRSRDLPGGFAAVLSGHIHRGQRLAHGLDGRPLGAPVFYPGSVERTSFAERFETKGYLILRLRAEAGGGRVEGFQFHPLPTRPMAKVALDAGDFDRPDLDRTLRTRLEALDSRSVVRLEVPPGAPACVLAGLTAARLRALAPPEMLLELAWRPGPRGESRPRSEGQ